MKTGHDYFLQLAVQQACEAVRSGEGYPYGAVIVDAENCIMATGYNTVKCE